MPEDCGRQIARRPSSPCPAAHQRRTVLPFKRGSLLNRFRLRISGVRVAVNAGVVSVCLPATKKCIHREPTKTRLDVIGWAPLATGERVLQRGHFFPN